MGTGAQTCPHFCPWRLAQLGHPACRTALLLWQPAGASKDCHLLTGLICLLCHGKGLGRKEGGVLGWTWYVGNRRGKAGGSQCSKSSVFLRCLGFIPFFRHTRKLGLHAFKLTFKAMFGFSFLSPKNQCCNPGAHLGTQCCSAQQHSPAEVTSLLICPGKCRKAAAAPAEPGCQTCRKGGAGSASQLTLMGWRRRLSGTAWRQWLGGQESWTGD